MLHFRLNRFNESVFSQKKTLLGCWNRFHSVFEFNMFAHNFPALSVTFYLKNSPKSYKNKYNLDRCCVRLIRKRLTGILVRAMADIHRAI